MLSIKKTDKKLILYMKNLDVLTIEDLRLILAIVEEGSLTSGAARMRIGQSNASYSLKKIQSAFRSDLFLRKSRKLVPSEFGWHVYQHTKTMLEGFKTVVHPPVFDPDSEFTLHFGATEYETIAVFPRILEILKIHAPKAKIRINALETADLTAQLERLDFAFVPANLRSSSISTMKILEDSYVTIYDEAIRDAPVSIKDFALAHHAIASFDGSTVTNIDHLLAKEGLKREIAMSVFGFAALAGLLRNSDFITTLPKRIASGAFSGLATCKCPLKIDPMPLYFCWETAKEERGKIRWFIRLMMEHLVSHQAGNH